MYQLKLLVAAICVLSTIAYAEKDILLDDPTEWILREEYMKSIVPAPIKRRNVWTESVPEACIKEMLRPYPPNPQQAYCAVKDITVVQFWFTDSTCSWITCRCADTQYSEEQMVTTIARIPPNLRQTVRFFIGLKEYEGGYAAHARVPDLTFFTGPNLFIFLHEIGHGVDSAVESLTGRTIDPSIQGSKSQGFLDAVEKDTCFITNTTRSLYHNSPDRSSALLEVWAWTFVYISWQQRLGSLGKRLPNGIGCLKSFQVILDQTKSVFSEARNEFSAPESGTGLKKFNAAAVAAVVPYVN